MSATVLTLVVLPVLYIWFEGGGAAKAAKTPKVEEIIE
jgi:Cu/Ag efflux pump CusA